VAFRYLKWIGMAIVLRMARRMLGGASIAAIQRAALWAGRPSW
jgi:hypothetical protein